MQGTAWVLCRAGSRSSNKAEQWNRLRRCGDVGVLACSCHIYKHLQLHQRQRALGCNHMHAAGLGATSSRVLDLGACGERHLVAGCDGARIALTHIEHLCTCPRVTVPFSTAGVSCRHWAWRADMCRAAHAQRSGQYVGCRARARLISLRDATASCERGFRVGRLRPRAL